MGMGDNALDADLWFSRQDYRNVKESYAIAGPCLPILARTTQKIDGGEY